MPPERYILRWNPRSLHEALNAGRQAGGLRWTETAEEIGEHTAGMLTNLAHNTRLGFPGVMRITGHRAIPRAIALAAEAALVQVEPEWVHTSKLRDLSLLAGAAGVWCVPASPYANTAGALSAIRYAREQSIPFLGTCGGFQHAVLEVADALWAVKNPAHAELEPHRPEPVIAPLLCSLVEETGDLRFAPDSRIAEAYGCCEASEGYHCRYGLNPLYHRRLTEGPLRATAWDLSGDVRGVELDGHPFFVATLFQPERQALLGRVPPLVTSLLLAMAGERPA